MCLHLHYSYLFRSSSGTISQNQTNNSSVFKSFHTMKSLMHTHTNILTKRERERGRERDLPLKPSCRRGTLTDVPKKVSITNRQQTKKLRNLFSTASRMIRQRTENEAKLVFQASDCCEDSAVPRGPERHEEFNFMLRGHLSPCSSHNQARRHCRNAAAILSLPSEM